MNTRTMEEEKLPDSVVTEQGPPPVPEVDDNQSRAVSVKKNKKREPQTIEELSQWYIAHKLPPERETRFFIGKNIQEARAFGIYRSGNNVVVYKNKANGECKVRYEGPDEAFAVKEFLDRLKEEIYNQKAHNSSSRNNKHLTPEQRAAEKRAYEEAQYRHNFQSAIDGGLYFGGFALIFGFMGSLYSLLFKKIFLASLLSAGIAGIITFIYYIIRFKRRKRHGYFIDSFKKRVTVISILFICIYLVCFSFARNFYYIHYFKYKDTVYAQYRNKFYEYDAENNDYYYISDDNLPYEFLDSYSDYEFDFKDTFSSEGYYVEFEHSNYYSDNFYFESTSGGSSDSDSGWDWDDDDDWGWDSGSDSWDSSWTDWDSDW